MKKIVQALLFIIFISAVLISISTGIFIGAGYVISRAVGLSLFQSSILAMGATFTLAFILCLFFISNPFPNLGYDDEYDDDDYEEENNSVPDKKLTVINPEKVGRNKLCPCGSGKKYKHCCYGK